MNNRWLLLSVSWYVFSCNAAADRTDHSNIPAAVSEQNAGSPLNLHGILPDSLLAKDSVAIMILPLAASCPSCRDKAIDSIMAFQKTWPPARYLVLSIDGTRKALRSYFKGAGHAGTPDMHGRLFFDSTDMAGKRALYRDNPSFYYLSNGKVYRRVDALPHTIREDLSAFFRKD